MTLTILANLRINNEEGLEHLKDSIGPLAPIGARWLVNVRGTRRAEALAIFRECVGNQATFFELLDDSRGWITNALTMLERAEGRYVLVFNEDHRLVASPQELCAVVEEMAERGAHYLTYSWWQKGRARRAFEALPLERGVHSDTVELTAALWQQARAAGHPYDLLSMAGIYEKSFLLRMFSRDRRKLAYALTPWFYRAATVLNRLGWRFDQRAAFRRIDEMLGYRLRRFPKETPFDMEKPAYRTDMLPLRLTLPHCELFACIDDDNVAEDRGSSLVARGRYPVRDLMTRFEGEPPAGEYPYQEREQKISAGETIDDAYYFGSIKGRAHTAREAVRVRVGHMRVRVARQSIELRPGEGVAFFTSIPHTLEAVEDSHIVRYLPDAGLAPRYRAG